MSRTQYMVGVVETPAHGPLLGTQRGDVLLSTLSGGDSGSSTKAANGAGDGGLVVDVDMDRAPHSLRDALRAKGRSVDAESAGTTSEEDYDDPPRRSSETTAAFTVRRRKGAVRGRVGEEAASRATGADQLDHLIAADPSLRVRQRQRPRIGQEGERGAGSKSRRTRGGEESARRKNTIAAGDVGPRPQRCSFSEHSSSVSTDSLELSPSGHPRRRGKFSDLVFTQKYSAFDGRNEAAANSPFHGYFTLFWMAVFFFILKIGADNWREYGSPLGKNEAMSYMFSRDVAVLLASDGVMCGLTGVGWLLQRAVYAGYVDWDREGWILQNIWQATFMAGVVGWPMVRDWPWSHTVFFTLHGIVMLMKQHSYAFYNGYLSSVYKQRVGLLALLEQLRKVSPVASPSCTEPSAAAISTSHLTAMPSAHGYGERRQSVASQEKKSGSAGGSAAAEAASAPDMDRVAAAIRSGDPLDERQVAVFEHVIRWEVEAATDELRGKALTPARAYPHNLTAANHYQWIPIPTLVYELEYPRSDSINWRYAAEKLAACFGVIFVMIMVSQAFIYPVVMKANRMEAEGLPLDARLREFPWMFGDLLFPFLMEYLLSWYVIWETILNFLAEITFFADREFCGAWWNSVTWDQYAREWNKPVHSFLLRHVYHSSISALKVNKRTATLITFTISAFVHELVMWCIFKKLRGYLMVLQMCQLPLVTLSRTKWLRNKETLGNMMFWFGIVTMPSMVCSLYLIL